MNIDEVLRTVLERIKPKSEDYKRVNKVYNFIKSRVEEQLIKHELEAEVTLQGSIAKDTWLSDELDLDIFVLFPPKFSKEWLKEEAIRILVKALKDFNIQLSYAEHPYIRLNINGVFVDVVPAFKVSDPRYLKSAVDRTPLHTRYVLSKLSKEERDQVRLLKKFLKGIGVYGAEIKVQGFSGYLAELLIIKFKNFLNLLRNASSWKPPIIIDIEGYYDVKDYKSLVKRFKDQPLIVIDPTDPNRNVAAALSLKNLSIFIEASRSFLAKPDIRYFFPPRLSDDEYKVKIRTLISRRKTCIIGILLEIPSIPPDVLWGELRRVTKNAIRVLQMNKFNVVDYAIWSNEKSKAIILIELIEETLPEYEVHLGPPVTNVDHSYKFKDKYSKLPNIIGPWIGDDGRWRILRPRRWRNAIELLRFKRNEIIVTKHLRNCNVEFIKEHDLEKTFNHGGDWLQCLYKFLVKRPPWI